MFGSGGRPAASNASVRLCAPALHFRTRRDSARCMNGMLVAVECSRPATPAQRPATSAWDRPRSCGDVPVASCRAAEGDTARLRVHRVRHTRGVCVRRPRCKGRVGWSLRGWHMSHRTLSRRFRVCSRAGGRQRRRCLWCMLHVRCMLYVAGCVLHVACCMLYVACRGLHVLSRLSGRSPR